MMVSLSVWLAGVAGRQGERLLRLQSALQSLHTDTHRLSQSRTHSAVGRWLRLLLRLAGRRLWAAVSKAYELLAWGVAPRMVLALIYRHFVMAVGLYIFRRLILKTVSVVGVYVKSMWVSAWSMAGDGFYSELHAMEKRLEQAHSFAEWRHVASSMDLLQGRHQWKNDPESHLFDWERISSNLRTLRELNDRNDVPRLTHYLRANLLRNLGGIGRKALYSKLRVGTKRVIEEYIAEVIRSLDLVCVDGANSVANRRLPALQRGRRRAPRHHERSHSAVVQDINIDNSAPQVQPLSLATQPSPSPPRPHSAMARNAHKVFTDATTHKAASPDLTASPASLVGDTEEEEEEHEQHQHQIDEEDQEEEEEEEGNINNDNNNHHNIMTVGEKLAFFNETRHAFGRSALLLSGGATMSMYHMGVIKALWENKLLPRVISGSSAGSIFAGMLGVKTDEELADLTNPGAIKLAFFPPHKGRVGRKIGRLMRKGVLLDIEILSKCIRENLGDYTFQEAYDRTGRIINIIVSPTDTEKEIPRLLNYLTAPNVLIWSAASASSAIPGVYDSIELMAKDPDTGDIVPYHSEGGVRWCDGSVMSDLPMRRLSELFNVNHFIVSQTNPHIVPFLFGARRFREASLVQRLIRYLGREVRQRITNILGLIRIDYRLPWTSALEFWTGLASQKYTGDITLVPKPRWRDFVSLLSNPTEKLMREYMRIAERYTWEHMSLIHAHCALEFALDHCVRRMRIAALRAELGLGVAPVVQVSQEQSGEQNQLAAAKHGNVGSLQSVEHEAHLADGTASPAAPQGTALVHIDSNSRVRSWSSREFSRVRKALQVPAVAAAAAAAAAGGSSGRDAEDRLGLYYGDIDDDGLSSPPSAASPPRLVPVAVIDPAVRQRLRQMKKLQKQQKKKKKKRKRDKKRKKQHRKQLSVDADNDNDNDNDSGDGDTSGSEDDSLDLDDDDVKDDGTATTPVQKHRRMRAGSGGGGGSSTRKRSKRSSKKQDALASEQGQQPRNMRSPRHLEASELSKLADEVTIGAVTSPLSPTLSTSSNISIPRTVSLTELASATDSSRYLF